MANHSHLPFADSHAKGYRLHKVELLNWGTFDGQIYSARPAGMSALLIGQNGSGKSTLVDALLTLLVRPGVRNFNVAAGAKKRERDERSYLLGAYDRGSDEEGQGIRVKYLRQKGDRYSVILATFRNEDVEKSFTVAQVLYLTSDQSVDKVYCFSEDERSIQDDFSQLESSEAILKTLKQRGLRATKTFQEYEGWFQRTTRVKSKAMEVFNQTVAVKDIQKLNDFIRDHMLEAHDWSEKVDCLLGHFTQLSEAHDSLVKARQQRDLLEPVARIGSEYREQAETLERAERLQSASAAYFSQRTIDLFVPLIADKVDECDRVRKHRETLTTDIKSLQVNCRSLQNQIDQVGGDRLKEIPRLIDIEQERGERKRQASQFFHDALRRLGIEAEICDQSDLTKVQSRLPSLRSQFEAEARQNRERYQDLVLERGQLRKQLTEMREELTGLERRRENIPEWSVQLRGALCDELGLAIRDLPFAAELMQVRPEETDWEASIEKVLHGLALSLLVPDRFYSLVATHIERTRLTAHGRGQRLVYLRVAEQEASRSTGAAGRHSMIHKLVFREGQSLLPWLKAELIERFDYACCDSIEELQSTRGLAMTRNRHVKSGRQRHEKDDRDHVVDPRNFVLGWDNREKKLRLAQEIERLSQSDHSLTSQLERLERLASDLQSKLTAVESAQKITSFSEIDFQTHDLEIRQLEEERRAIESQSDALRVLKQRLTDAEARCELLQQSERRLIGDERLLQDDITKAKQLVKNAENDLRRRQAEGSLEAHRASFADLDAVFVDPPLTAETLFEMQRQWRERQDRQIARIRELIEPIRNKLTDAMARFLRFCPEESAELRGAIDYLDGFLELRQRILEDDLPRHEQRFKERLNKKVIEEIAVFRNGLEQERRVIEDKIELLNLSLKKLEYRPDTHIQLQPRPVRDAEIIDFQTRLRDCVEESFDDSAEANEARFLRIRELIVRLQDDDTRRWRDKVTDVRRWFDFVAEVIDRHTLKSRAFRVF
ncbi:ATP-binding protein [Thalassoglobus sp.]|uniref:ATP-binding protein n=1 Tax=Thalassoglobus sp. TaxID=2795869 RepID=UPI003AA8BCBA